MARSRAPYLCSVLDGQALCDSVARLARRHRGPVQADLPWVHSTAQPTGIAPSAHVAGRTAEPKVQDRRARAGVPGLQTNPPGSTRDERERRGIDGNFQRPDRSAARDGLRSCHSPLKLPTWNRAITDVVEAPTHLEPGSVWKVRIPRSGNHRCELSAYLRGPQSPGLAFREGVAASLPVSPISPGSATRADRPARVDTCSHSARGDPSDNRVLEICDGSALGPSREPEHEPRLSPQAIRQRRFSAVDSVSSARRARTLPSISSTIGRTTSRGFPAGSSSSQSR